MVKSWETPKSSMWVLEREDKGRLHPCCLFGYSRMPETMSEYKVGDRLTASLAGGRIVEATVKAIHETTEGMRLQVSCGEETVISMSLMANEAAQHTDALGYLSAMLEMYNIMSFEADRKNVRPIIDSKLRYESKLIDLSIKNSNGMIGFTRGTGVATTATNFKEELRRVKEMLSQPYQSLTLRRPSGAPGEEAIA